MPLGLYGYTCKPIYNISTRKNTPVPEIGGGGAKKNASLLITSEFIFKKILSGELLKNEILNY